MQLYPAIDLMNGQAVRLRQGRRDDVTVYGEPVAIANRLRASGATWLHLVDLGAAFDGQVELGGGLRSMEDIALRMEAGVARCIIGTAAIEQPNLVREACERWPGRIAVGIDAKNGLVATRGWTSVSHVTAAELALQMKEAGVNVIIYTDVSRDGMMQGPNVAATRALIEATGMQVTGSGGVSSLDDLRALKAAGCAGAILGKALYEGAFTLEDAMKL